MKDRSVKNSLNGGSLDSYTYLILVFHPRSQRCGGYLPYALLLVKPGTVIAYTHHVLCLIFQVQLPILAFLSSPEITVYHQVLVLQFNPILVQIIGSLVSLQLLVFSTSCLILRLWFSSQQQLHNHNW